MILLMNTEDMISTRYIKEKKMERTFYGNSDILPGVSDSATQVSNDLQAQFLLNGKPQNIIGEEEIVQAAQTLQEYKQGKANLENRVVNDELWWELRHWQAIRGNVKDAKGNPVASPNPTSAWLFNTIINKHADLMDNYPVPVVLPREQSDESSAKTLSSILPVIMETNDFEETYSYAGYEKIKHGSAVWGVFWDKNKDNGLGDISIKNIDILNIFWEPGITDIQQSKNIFIVDLVDNDVLEEKYPELQDKLKGNALDVTHYVYDESIDTSKKSVVVDWYYKVQGVDGIKRLHYVKFVNKTVLYASENDPEVSQVGIYEHGEYPVVFDTLFPEKTTPFGFGMVSICMDPQLYIDKLSANILETSLVNTKKRYFVSDQVNVDIDEMRDMNKPFVKVSGAIDPSRLMEIQSAPISPVYSNIIEQKINEMKDTAANKDVNSGGTGSGVTAASAIAALQEAGNKVSRDMISASYRAYTKVCRLVIELIRQFYDVQRAFRITQEDGSYEFITFNNADIVMQENFDAQLGEVLYRKPVFDLKIKAQKKSPFSRMEENERAKELYAMSFFAPEKAQESLIALDMMDFEGIDKVREKVMQGQTLMNMLQQATQVITNLTGIMPGGSPMASPTSPMPQGNSGMTDKVMEAQTPMTSYGQRLAARSGPDINKVPNGASPK